MESQDIFASESYYNRFFKEADFQGVKVPYKQFRDEWDKLAELAIPEQLFDTNLTLLGKDSAVKKKFDDLKGWQVIQVRTTLFTWGLYIATSAFGLKAYLAKGEVPLSNLFDISKSIWKDKRFILGAPIGLGSSIALNWYVNRRVGLKKREYSVSVDQAVRDNARELRKDMNVRCAEVGTSQTLQFPKLEKTCDWIGEGYQLAVTEPDGIPLLLMLEYKIDELLKKGVVSLCEAVAFKVLLKVRFEQAQAFVTKNQVEPGLVRMLDEVHFAYSGEPGFVKKRQPTKDHESIPVSEFSEFVREVYAKDPIHQVFERVIRFEQKKRCASLGVNFEVASVYGKKCYAHPLFVSVDYLGE